MIIPVVLCGGVGSRLWPLSRKTNPKQFISLKEDSETLFDQTIERITGDFFDDPIIVCNQEYEFRIREALNKRNITPKKIILESEGRNTAAAIALAAFIAEEQALPGNFLIMPADHYIEDYSEFIKYVEVSNKYAEKKLITFGIKPSKASTAYGYIKQGPKLDKGVYLVEEFVEKPNLEIAQKYLESGDYSWNSGIFLFNPKFYLKELQTHSPEIYFHTKNAIEGASHINELCKPQEKSFLQNPDISVDYAVLEKTKEVILCPVDINWSDVGSWESVYNISEKDSAQNALVGDVISVESSGNFVYSGDRLTTILGVKDLVVVSTKDAVLVSHKSKSENVKHIVSSLKSAERKEYSDHLKIYRPWGFYEDIDQGKDFRVKRINVKPGERLSLQKHQHRSEHWIVVKGEATVINGDQTVLLKAGESTFVPAKTKHRLSNNTNIQLEIIEVQIGGYLGEDDIERFEDVYGRLS